MYFSINIFIMYVCMYTFCVGKWSILFADEHKFIAVFCKDFGVIYYNTFSNAEFYDL